MKELWIEKSGLCSEDEIVGLLSAEAAPNSFYLAGLTDQYVSGYAKIEEFERLELWKLLDIRVFSEERELFATRSMLGQEFAYRIASDEALQKNYNERLKEDLGVVPLPETPEANYLIRYQYIDINELMSQEEADEQGSRPLMTTVGGSYRLPITKGINMVKLMTYLTYDENGMAKITDNRLCGFVKEEVRNAEQQ